MAHSLFKMINGSIKHWYIPLIVGVLFIVFGLYIFTIPVAAYLGLVIIFIISFVVSGVAETAFAISNRKVLDNWGWILAGGLLNLVIGILMFLNPLISIEILPFYVGFVILFRSIMVVVFASDLKSYGVRTGDITIMGVLGIIFAFIMLWNPLFAGATLIVWTALALIFFGAANVYVSFQLKKIHDLAHKIPDDIKKKYHDAHDTLKAAVKGK